jgi:hypothetical protein
MNNLTITEFKEIRVLTTQQLSESYETDSRVISNNFNRNKERYLEGKHYILLQGEDLKEFKTSHQNDESLLRVNQLYLWTEKGAFLHAKSLNTDKAWEVYDRLVDTYFHKQVLLDNLSTEMKALIMHDKKIQLVMDHIETQEQKIEDVNDDLQTFKKDMPLLGLECDRITTAIKTKGVNTLGGKESNSYRDKSLRGKVYSDIHHQIKREFGVSTYKAIKRSQTDLVLSIVDGYSLPLALQEEIKDCNSQINL